MWWKYLSKSLWGTNRRTDKPIVSLIVLFPRRERIQWVELLVLYLWPRKNWPEKEKRCTRENGHVVLGSVTAKEGWMLGSARLVSKTWGKLISEIPPENPWAQVLWRKTFPLRGREAHRKSIQTTQLQLLIFRSLTFSFPPILCLFLPENLF